MGDRSQVMRFCQSLLLMAQKSGEKTTWDGAETLGIMGILATPPKATPPRNKALLRAY